MKNLLFFLLFILYCPNLNAKTIYSRQDSIKVISLLTEAARMLPSTEWVVHFAEKFTDMPYVAGTLDKGDQENLIVNLHQLDCTTFVETVLALKMCAERHEQSFDDYCRHLREVRYIDGKVKYDNRKHYFSVWIEDNVKQAIISKVEPSPGDLKTHSHPFSAIQHLSDVNYMSMHISLYKMLSAHREWLNGIKAMEQSMQDREYRYIPKSALDTSNPQQRGLLRRYIKTGDVIVILTSKKGLDTSHIGIAVWKGKNLHLLNASQIHKKVILEPMTLSEYMKKHPSQLGIRVVRATKQ